MSDIQLTWNPILNDETASQLIAESDGPFTVTINNTGAVQQVSSEHDGLIHFVSMDVPLAAKVQVAE